MDKLNRSKTLLVILAFLLFSSCSFEDAIHPHHTEVLCQDLGSKFLIRHIRSDDFWRALDKFIAEKAARGTNETYTVLIFRDHYSLMFKGIKAEDMRDKCFTRDVMWTHVEKDYTVY